MSRIRWGIIGAGGIAQAFARGIVGSQTGSLVAVASRDKARAQAFVDQYVTGACRSYGSYDELLADRDVHAVYIATPHPMHAKWAILAAQAGKHVLVEKPAGINQAQAMAMIEACRLNQVLFMEAFMYRCHGQTLKLIELLKAKAIGQVQLIRASFGFFMGFNATSRVYANDLAGGGLMDVGCYPISMARLIAGAATGKNAPAEPLHVKAVAHLGPTGVDHYTAAVAEFPGAIIAELSTAVQQNLENAVHIYGDQGRITLTNPWLADRTNPSTGTISVYKNDVKEPQQYTLTADNNTYGLEIDYAGRAILAGKTQADYPAMTPADTLGNLRAMDQWRQSIGMTFDMEKPGNITTITGQPLNVAPQNNMRYGQVPHLEKRISRLIMGCDNQPSLPHAAVMFDDWFERGGNTFDTAYIYGGGRHELFLGQWIKTRGVRDQVTVITKGAHTPFCNPADLTRQLLTSLERLQFDHADIYIMHRDNPEVPVGEFVDVLNEHVKAGRIKTFGGSNWSIERFTAANEYARQKGLQPFSILNNNFSLARMVDPIWPGCVAASDPASRKWLTQSQTTLLSWSSQARGFFVPEISAPDKTDDAERVRCWYSDDNFRRQARAIELADKYKVLPINIALAYVLCQPFPTFALVGPRMLSETHTTLPGLDIQLSHEELKYLNLED
ncbi:MAG: aldo/keto reductase [Phycisphaerales bacterium]|nr:aldo/keto reductase [Phycisphaerales bacterium]